MWELGHKEGWALKNWCFQTVVLEKAFESHLNCKEIKPVIPKGNQSWIFIGRTDAEAEAPTLATWWEEALPPLNQSKRSTDAEAPVLWPPDAESWLIGKRPWCWERLRAGEEGGDRGWDGWMASLTWWTWVWANFRKWWRPGKPGMLQSLGSQSQTGRSNWTTLTVWDRRISRNESQLFSVWFFFSNFKDYHVIVVILLNIKTVNEQRPTNAFTSSLQ